MITSKQLKDIFPSCRDPAMWSRVLPPAAKEFGIDTPAKLAEWLAQLGVESGQLNTLKENLSYSVRGLMATWPKRFPSPEVASKYARQPEKIANLVYANRLGNGPPESGEGFKYRGRGLIQVTGKSNYAACGAALSLPLLSYPQKLEDPIHAARSAAWYWQARDLDEVIGDVEHDRRVVNGGTHGLAECQAFYAKAKEVLGV